MTPSMQAVGNSDLPLKFSESESGTSHLACEGQNSASLFDLLSLTHSSPSLSSTLLEDIDLDLQCDNDDVDDTFQDCGQAEISNCRLNDFVTAEVYTLSKLKPNNLISFPQAVLPSNHRGITKCSTNIVSNRETILSYGTDSTCGSSKKISSSHNLSPGVIKCNFCSVQFSSKQSLNSHMKDKHTIKQEFACPFCGKVSRDEQSLKKHEKTHRKELYYSSGGSLNGPTVACLHFCTFCPHVSKTKRLLREHVAAKHSKNRKIYRCSRCSFSCLKQQTLSLHIRRHEDEPKFACDQCGKLFLTMSILKRHANTHNKMCLYPCSVPGCGKSFNIKGRLTDHVRTVHKSYCKSSEIILQQAQSVAPFVTQDKIYPHTQYSSLEEEKSFVSSSSHQEECLNTTQKSMFSADIVVYDVILSEHQIQAFQSSESGNKHLSECNQSRRQLGTEFCNSLEDLSNLMKNKKSWCLEDLGPGVKPAGAGKPSLCSTIEQERTEIRGLVGQSWEASQLEHCDKTQVEKGIIKMNFVCSWAKCGKRFRDNYNLRMHRSTHTGEMQRACTLCRYRCVQKSALDSHMAKHLKHRQELSSN